MYISSRAKFRIGIGLIMLPAFVFGILLGVLLILLLSVRPVYASDTGEVGKTATATTKITLILRGTETNSENRETDKREPLNTVVVEEGEKIIIEPI